MRKICMVFFLLIAMGCTLWAAQAEEEITVIASGECGEEVFWELDSEGNMTLSGEGKMVDYESRYQQPWYGNDLKKLVIEEGITHIGAYAFDSVDFSELYWPDSIESVGSMAFGGSNRFGRMYISSIESWLGISFAGPNANPLFTTPYLYVDGEMLTDLVIPGSITEIKDNAFGNYTQLRRVVLHEDITDIGHGAFPKSYISAVVPADSYALRWCVENKVAYHLTSGTCGDNAAWSLNRNGLLTITGTGAMYDYRDDRFTDEWAPWFPIRDLVKSVSICDGITRIGEYVFQANRQITEISIPASVESIGKYAFSECTSLRGTITLPAKISRIEDHTFDSTALEGIVIPEGTTFIGEYAFAGAAIREIVFPDSIETIGEGAFSECRSLGKVALPAKLTHVSGYAFAGCASLSSVVFNNRLEGIYASAFSNCSALTSVSLPASIQFIEDAFSGCDNLKEIHIPDIEWWLSLSFRESGSPFRQADEMYIGGEPVKEIVVPDSITAINDGAFSHMRFLTGVVIPDSVTSIGQYAFYRCANLEQITFPDQLLEIGHCAFSYCDALKSVSLPDSLATLGESAFAACANLESIYIPAAAGYVSDSCFYDCGSLKDVVLGEGITSIHNMAFYGCHGLESIRLPDSLGSIESFAFSSTDLKVVKLPQNLKYIGSDAFSFTPLTRITIPANVKNINDCAFDGCENLKYVFSLGKDTSFGHNIFRNTDSPTFYCLHGSTAVDYIALHATEEEDLSYAYIDAGEGVLCLPAALKAIREKAFENLTPMSVILPDGCEIIGPRAFAGNANLAFVYMPDSVITIADDAFDECSKVFFLCESENAAAAYAGAHSIPFEIA